MTAEQPARRTASWPPVLCMQDLADLLGLQSERAARNFVTRREVPHIKEGRRILVLLDSLLAWLKSKEATPNRAARVHSVMDGLRGAPSRKAEAIERAFPRR